MLGCNGVMTGQCPLPVTAVLLKEQRLLTSCYTLHQDLFAFKLGRKITSNVHGLSFKKIDLKIVGWKLKNGLPIWEKEVCICSFHADSLIRDENQPRLQHIRVEGSWKISISEEREVQEIFGNIRNNLWCGL